jgi:hypothetical protein
MRSVLLVASLILGTAGTAAAQPGLTPAVSSPPQAAQPPPAAPPAQPQGEVSEGAALGLSLGGTAAAWTVLLTASENHGSGDLVLLGLAGVVTAPSFGHWYAHSVATRGLGLRLAGLGSFTVAVALAVQCEDECSNGTAIEGAALLGLGLLIAGTIDDIVTAPGEARRYNERLQGLAIVPMVKRDTGGLMLTGRF